VALINHNDIEAQVTQIDTLSCHHSKTGNQNSSMLLNFFDLLFSVTLLCIIKLLDWHVNVAAPLCEFSLPVRLHSSWHGYQNFAYLI
jgi:hypothetical protein